MTDFVEKFKKLNNKQQNAIALFLTGDNNKTVAKKVGVDENTVYRWRNSETFKNILTEMRIQHLQNLEIKLHNLSEKALDKLSYLLDSADNENNQLKASLFILDKSLQYEQLEIIKRINSIEERLKNEKL